MNDTEIFRKAPRMAPVIFLLDCSGSMFDNGKINTLNYSVRNMIKQFQQENSTLAEFGVMIYTFSGNGVDELIPLTNVKELDVNRDLPEMQADGGTPMGAALREAKKFIENDESMHKCYRPIIILVSDGMPNDDGWEKAVDDFAKNGRSSRCQRLALSIEAPRGTDQFEILKRYTQDSEKIFYAENADKMVQFFDFVSKSITSGPQNDIKFDFYEAEDENDNLEDDDFGFRIDSDF